MQTPAIVGGEAARRLREPLATNVAALVAAATAAGSLGCSSAATLDQSCSQTASGLDACPGNSVVHGVDVSTYQGAIVWSRARAAGVAFAFARVSDGLTVRDSQFADNWSAMKDAGVLRGAYQFFRAGEDPLAQASLAVAALDEAGGLLAGDLPVVMDMETSDAQSSAMVQAGMTIWLEAVTRATGRRPIIYTSSATSSVIGSGFADYALWVANWGATCPSMPSGWSTWRFWQYSDRGAVSGISGSVDLDEFDGPLADLLTFAGVPTSDADGADGPAVDAPNTDAPRTEEAGSPRHRQPCTQ